jgi:outer membrane protein OmpA-like peptidoglycan-associated protein
MNFKTTSIYLAIVLVAFSANAAGPDSSRVGQYDFSYVTSGDVRATPVQVFDDGKSTYFQFRANDMVPAIFTSRGELVAAVQDGQFVKVPTISGRYVLQAGRSQALVIHSGGTRPDAPQLNAVAANGMQTPYTGGGVAHGTHVVVSLAPTSYVVRDDAINHNSYATPRRGDRVVWTEGEPRRDEVQVWFARGSSQLTPDGRRTIAAAARAGNNARFIVIGRDDDTYKEGLDKQRAQTLREALVKAGADDDQITVRTGIASKGKGSHWASNIIVETERPAPDIEPTNRSAVANLEALVRMGVLRQDQAEAIAQGHGAHLPTSIAASTGVGVRPEATNAGGGNSVVFTLMASDKTIQGAVRRWAASANYTVVWDAPKRLDPPITGDLTIRAASLKDALKLLLVGLSEKGYALDADFYSDGYIRVTPAGSAVRSSDQGTAKSAVQAPSPQAAPPAVPPTNSIQRAIELAPQQRRDRRGPSTVAELQWQMLQGDGNVERMLSRWAQQARTLVVWSASDRPRITGDAVVVAPSFKAATEQVIAGAAAAGYHLKVYERDDRTLVVANY